MMLTESEMIRTNLEKGIPIMADKKTRGLKNVEGFDEQ
jgi:hypothetical protein